jgi:hypothetical protein
MTKRKRRILNDPRHTATHEAGHAVIARVLTLACGGAAASFATPAMRCGLATSLH